MKTIRAIFLTLGWCASVMTAGNAWADGGTFTVSSDYNIGLTIPDNNPSGLAVAEPFSAPGLFSISSLTVTLDINGGVNGDYYAYLQHGSGFTVLLNRVGRDSGNSTGYGDAGVNVTLDDSAANGDIHTYQLTLNPGGSQLTGTWAPDGRNVDPSISLTTTPRTTALSDFDGLDPNGQWTLFVADADQGGQGTLESFALNVTGIPEPSSVTLIMAGGVCLCLGLRLCRQS